MPSSNPLWFGYYPGDRPVYKKPDKMMPSQPIEITNMGLNEALDEAINMAGKPAEMPGTLWDWITDDWKSRFLVGASAGVQTGEELLQFSREEVADVRGAYISLNLADLVTNPSKTITKFVQSSINPLNPFNALSSFEGEFWTDLDTAQEKQMWVDLLDPPTRRPLLFDETKRSFGPLEFTGQGVYADKTFGSPLAGEGVNITLSGAGATDVYENVKKGTLDFVLTKKTGLFRNGGYRRMQNSFITAATTELRVKEVDINTALAADPIFGLERGTRLEAFKAEGGLAKTLSKFDDGLEDVQKVISKTGIGAPVTLARVQAALNDLQTTTGTISTQILQTRTVLNPLFGERDKFNHDIKELENYINDVNKVVAKYSGITSMGRLGGAENMVSEIQQLRTRFSNARYMGGTQDRYLESLGRRYFEGERSILKFDPVNPGTGNPILSDGFKSISTVYEVQKRAYWQESGRDVAKAFSKGEYGKNYLWFGGTDITIAGKTIPVGLIRDRIQVFTPGYWTGQLVERTHKFGLVYNEKLAEKGGVLHPVFEKLPWIRTHTFTENFTANGVKLSAKLTGSKDLQAFYNSWESAKKNQLVGSYDTAMKVTGFGSPTDNMQGFFDLLNGRGGYLRRDTLGYLGSTGDWKSMVTDQHFRDIRGALINNKLGLHLDPLTGDVINDAYNQAILGGLFKEIGRRKAGAATISPFVNKVGVLQIYASKISQAQLIIYRKLGFNKLTAPFVRFKALFAQKFAGLISKIALKAGLGALTAATGGLAALILPIAEKLMHIVLAKAIDAVKDLGRAILKGNFSEAFDHMMNDAMNATQKVITCGCIVPIVTSFAILLLMGTVITSISPVDRSKAPSSASSGGSVVPLPPGNITGGKLFKDAPGCNGPTTCGSYGNVAVSCRHGTNSYWDGVVDLRCSYNIPTGYVHPTGLKGTTVDSASYCYNTSPAGSIYGYAADYAPGCAGEETVYVPKISDATKWELKHSFDAGIGKGWGVVLRSKDGSASYTVLILHMQDSSGDWTVGKEFSVGVPIGVLHPHPGGKHVHIELSKGGVVVQPEANL